MLGIDRRSFLQLGAATAASILTPGCWRGGPSRGITQEQLLDFPALGNVTLMHLTDLHAQLVPVYFREPDTNLGVGEVHGKVPHLTGKAFLQAFGIQPGSMQAYMLAADDFGKLAAEYGRVGGLDRMATVVKHIRAQRPGALLLDGGDTWQGSYTSLQSGGADMVKAMQALGVDAMTAHWEFTYGTERVRELVDALGFPFLAGNVRDTDWDEPVFESTAWFERGGVKIAVIGQAFPYTPVANPRYLIPEWSFGIREEAVAASVAAAREAGAELVVLLSHNGFDVDRKLASRVPGIDVLLSGHTHDAVPEAIQVGQTLLIASGSHGKFLSRLDLDVKDGKVRDYRYQLIPILSDVITPDAEMSALIQDIRKPHEALLSTVLGTTDELLYRRGNFNGRFDDLICQALMQERDAEIALSPGFRWGASLLPGMPITVEDVHNVCSITYPNAYRTQMTGARLHETLEDVADNLFNPDPYYQQGGDMVRVGGIGYRIDVRKPQGQRITDLTLLRSGKPLQADREYSVAGWASVNPETQGPPIWDVVSNYIRKHKTVSLPDTAKIHIVGA